jgi:hypothetical protein
VERVVFAQKKAAASRAAACVILLHKKISFNFFSLHSFPHVEVGDYSF